MRSLVKTRVHEDPKMEADRVVRELAKIAFANMADFATFDSNGEILDIDFEKAREVGATVSVVSRKVGRGKNAGTVVTTTIEMPDKVRALIQLGKHLGLFQDTRADGRDDNGSQS